MKLFEHEDQYGNYLGVFRYEGFQEDEGDRVILHQSDVHDLVDVELPHAKVKSLIKALQKVVTE